MYKNSVPRYIHCASGIVHNRTKIKRTRARRNNEKKKKKKESPLTKFPYKKKISKFPAETQPSQRIRLREGVRPTKSFTLPVRRNKRIISGQGWKWRYTKSFPGE